MTSTLIAGPGAEPVALAEAKAWCRVDATDEDALLTALIVAARLQVESLIAGALITQSWRLAATCPRGRLVPLPVAPVQAVTIATADGEPIDVTLQADAVLLPGEGYGSLVIDYTAGYGDAADVPQDLKQAVMGLIGFWFENRDTAMATTPAGLERLLAPYKRVRL